MVIHKGMFIREGQRITSGLRLSTYIRAHNQALIEHLHALRDSQEGYTEKERMADYAFSLRRGRQASKFLSMALILANEIE